MENEHQTKHETENSIILEKSHQVMMFFGLTAVVLFVSLFSTYPAAHDFFHGLRHALMIIPCH